MKEATVIILVTCPRCGTESPSEFPVLVVITALTRWKRMALYAPCHEDPWDATDAQLDAIRAQLGAEWIQAM